MIHKSTDVLWNEYCLKQNKDPSSAPSDEFLHLFEFFESIIKEKDQKLARAGKSLDAYKVHNHAHLQTNLAMANENHKLKKEISTLTQKLQVNHEKK